MDDGQLDVCEVCESTIARRGDEYVCDRCAKTLCLACTVDKGLSVYCEVCDKK